MLEKIRPQVQVNERRMLDGLDEPKLKRLLDQLMKNADQLLAEKRKH
jgi:hypothetical protein